MGRKGILFCVLLLTFGLLCGCTEKKPSAVTADELLEAICASQEALPPALTVLREDAPPESRGYFGKSHAALLYLGGREIAFPLFDRVCAARVRLSDSPCGCEIHILEAIYPEDVPLLENLLRERLSSLQKREIRLFLGEEYDRNVAAGQVVVRDRFVLLFTVPDPAAAVSAVDDLL